MLKIILRFLENEIHKTNLKMMEAVMVRKKYDFIKDLLKKVKKRRTFKLIIY